MKRKCSEFQHAGSQLADLGSHQHLEPRKPWEMDPWHRNLMESHGIRPLDLVTWLRRRPPQMCSCWSRKWPKGWRSWKTNCLRRQNSSIFRGYLWWAKWLDLGRWIFIHPKIGFGWFGLDPSCISTSFTVSWGEGCSEAAALQRVSGGGIRLHGQGLHVGIGQNSCNIWIRTFIPQNRFWRLGQRWA